MQDSHQLRILVIGATGIIGTHVTQIAVQHGHHVTGLSRNLNHGNTSFPGQEMLAVDVSEPRALEKALIGREYDATIDLLSFTPSQMEQTLASLRGRNKHYVFLSSATVSQGAAESQIITETSPLITHRWSYPLAKIRCESLLPEIAARSLQEFTIIRPYITYSEQRLAFGPWESNSVLSRLKAGSIIPISHKIADAQTSLTHAADLATAIVGLAGKGEAYGEVIQVASPESMTWREVYQMTADILKVDLNLRIISDTTLNRTFPETAGKFNDRRLERIFSSEKLQSTLEDFRFHYSPRRGYTEVLQNWNFIEKDMSPRAAGRIDRLVGENWKSSHDHARRSKSASSLGAIKYYVGRVAFLDSVAVARGNLNFQNKRDTYS